MPGGRPSGYNQQIAAEICAQLGEGKSLRTICKAENMPGMSTVFQWLAAHTEFAEQYARARDSQADALFEEILEIADDGSNDWMNTEHGPRLDSENVQRSRLRVDSRKWMIGKLAPKKYGEKVEHEHSGVVRVERIERVVIDVEDTNSPRFLTAN